MIYCLIFLGGLLEIMFIQKEHEKKVGVSTLFKGMASLMFVVIGLLKFMENSTAGGTLILAGLLLGLLGDIMLNLRFFFSGAKNKLIFGIGIFAFFVGHILYIATILLRNLSVIIPAVIMAGIISVCAVPFLLRSLTVDVKGLRAFGSVYFFMVSSMFSSSFFLLVKEGVSEFTILFAVGAFLFMLSDFTMIYYSFCKKVRPLRAINLFLYYIGQVLIALCIVGA